MTEPGRHRFLANLVRKYPELQSESSGKSADQVGYWLVGRYWRAPEVLLDLFKLIEQYETSEARKFDLTPVIQLLSTAVERQHAITQQDPRRAQLIQTVDYNWIQGFLRDALRDALIPIEFHLRPDLVPSPVDLVWRTSTDSADPIPNTPNQALAVWQQSNGQLLILGAPGSGKTVLLLQLAELLLDLARNQAASPVPIVLNLSSWSKELPSLKTWIQRELRQNYGVGERWSQEWIDGDRLIYLFDGLDEVAEDHRHDCLQAINAFLTPSRQVVVCSRIAEYSALKEQLQFEQAHELQTLPDERTYQLLTTHLPHVADKIWQTFHADPEVWREINTPLFIHVLITTYRDDRPFTLKLSQTDPLHQVQYGVIRPYVIRQLEQTTDSVVPFANDALYAYLGWIASNLRCLKETIFYVEMLQGVWLPPKQQSRLSRALNGIELDQKLVIQLPRPTEWVKKAIVQVEILGLAVGFFLGTFAGIFWGSANGIWDEIFWGMIIAQGALIVIFAFALQSRNVPLTARTRVNEGLQNSLFHGVIFGIVVGLLAAIVTYLFFSQMLFLGDLLGIFLFLGLLIGLWAGLSNVIKHLLLRRIASRAGLAPRRYDHLIAYLKDRRLMRQIGGGAVFIHRYFLEYFADEWERKHGQTDQRA